jgi:hypothetical protein
VRGINFVQLGFRLLPLKTEQIWERAGRVEVLNIGAILAVGLTRFKGLLLIVSKYVCVFISISISISTTYKGTNLLGYI